MIKTGLIYLITNNINKKKYIGQTYQSIEKRWNQHIKDYKRKKFLINNAIIKYGYQNFSIKVLKKIKNTNQKKLVSELNKLEKHYIKKHQTFVDWDQGGYNLTTGGMGKIWSKRSRKKLAKFLTGKTRSKETKLKMSLARLGKKQSAETLKKRSKWFEISYKDGTEEKILGLRNFCRENNYDWRAILRLKKKEISYHKDLINVTPLRVIL